MPGFMPRNPASVSTILPVAVVPNSEPSRSPPWAAMREAFEPPSMPARLPRAPRSSPPRAEAIWPAPPWLEASFARPPRMAGTAADVAERVCDSSAPISEPRLPSTWLVS